MTEDEYYYGPAEKSTVPSSTILGHIKQELHLNREPALFNFSLLADLSFCREDKQKTIHFLIFLLSSLQIETSCAQSMNELASEINKKNNSVYIIGWLPYLKL